MTTHTNIHIDANEVLSAVPLATTLPCHSVSIANAVTIFVNAENAAVILQLSDLLQAAALEHGATPAASGALLTERGVLG